MAEEAIKKVDEQLNCPICLQTFTDPKLLQCFHVYCQQCLEEMAVRWQRLTCPTCCKVTPIPADGGVAGLQAAFHINHLLEIKECLKKGGHVLLPTQENPVRRAGHCFLHKNKELELYCETCEELICWKCTAKGGGKHHDHDYEELDEAFEKYKKEISLSLEPIEKQVTTIQKALAQFDTRHREISYHQTTTKQNIRTNFERLREVLNFRETELIDQLDEMTKSKLKGLAAQRYQIETTLAQLQSCLHFMRESLRPGNEEDVLMMKTNTVNQIKELTTPFRPDILKPNTKADIAFSVSLDLTGSCWDYGQVFSPGLPDPSKCHVTSKGVEAAVMGETSTAIVQAVNFEDEPCEEPINLECELVSKIMGTRASCSVQRRGQSQYEISYQPTIKGRHQLHIKAEGQHVRGSPFSIIVKSPVEKLGAPILTIGGVKGPWGVAVNQSWEVVVTEEGGCCVSTISPTGEKIRSFGERGSGQGQFDHPRGVAVDGEGNILVADCWNCRIQMFTAEGQFLRKVGTKGTGPLQFNYPTDITVINNKVYVVDQANHRIQILTTDLTFSRTFGAPGSGEGQFNKPWCMACDSTGKVYVADKYNHRIQVFTAEGKFLRMFGRRGQGRGELGEPIGVAVDTSDMVYVSEGENHRVSVFTSEGQFVTSFGRRGEGPGEFKWPRGLTVETELVYVCDFGNNRVQIF